MTETLKEYHFTDAQIDFLMRIVDGTMHNTEDDEASCSGWKNLRTKLKTKLSAAPPTTND
jgi:hypothetical protein